MPRILLFAPCHRALIDKFDNSLSVIGVIHGLDFGAEQSDGTSTPTHAIAALDWWVASIWLRNQEDEDKVFEQRVEIVTPDGKKYPSEMSIEFRMTHRTHHIAVKVHGFPVGLVGEYKLKLHLREVGAKKWKPVAEYPIELKHIINEK